MANPVKLFESKSLSELTALRQEIAANPANREAAPGIYLYNKSTRAKFAAIDQAITWHLEAAREAKGNPVLRDGYTGRKSNRR